MNTCRFIVAIFMVFLVPPVWAVIEEIPSDIRKQTAELILEGEVVSISHQDKRYNEKHIDRHFVAGVKVSRHLKGKLSLGYIEVHYWRKLQRPSGWIGDTGQRNRVSIGEQRRFYLIRSQGELYLLSPNGSEALHFNINNALAASFNCEEAVSDIEKIICSDQDISILDDTLSTAYKRALASVADGTSSIIEQRNWFYATRKKCKGDALCIKEANEMRLIERKAVLKNEQRAWLKYERNICKDVDCLKKAYKSRILKLDHISGISSAHEGSTDDDHSKDNSIETLFIMLSDEAFENGVDGLATVERKELIKNNKSSTYSIAKRNADELLIHNNYARDSTLTIRRYVAEQVALLCVYTSNGQNNNVECWQGAKKRKLQDLKADDFIYQPERFPSGKVNRNYPVLMSIDGGGEIISEISLWSAMTGSLLQEDDIAYHMRYVWNPAENGSFTLQKSFAKKVVIFVEPDQQRMAEIKAEYGESMMTLMDDVYNYNHDAEQFLNKLQVKVVNVKHSKLSFFLDGITKTYDWSNIDKDWFIVIFDGINEPVVTDYFKIYDYKEQLSEK